MMHRAAAAVLRAFACCWELGLGEGLWSLALGRIDLRETLAIHILPLQLLRNETQRARAMGWDGKKEGDTRHEQGRDKTLPSKDESERGAGGGRDPSMTSDDRCSSEAAKKQGRL